MRGAAELLDEVGLAADGGALTIAGDDPVLPVELFRSRRGRRPRSARAVSPPRRSGGTALASRKTYSSTSATRELRRCSASCCRRLDGDPTLRTAEGLALVALYECGDGRWVHLHGAFPRWPSEPSGDRRGGR